MEHFDIAIIGTGSGNSILDERYTDKRVAICEQGTFGGTCLNVGCIPTKMFVYAAEVAENARDAARFGVDATVDGVRWSDIVSRVFGRIDPIAMGGENYRRSSPNVSVFDTHTRFGPTQSDGRYTLRTDGGDEFTADQVVIAAGSRATVPDAIRDCGVDYHTSDTIMRIGELPKHLDHRRWRVRRRGVRAHLLVARHAGHADHPRRHDVAALRRHGVRAVHRHRVEEVGDSQPPQRDRGEPGRRTGITLTMDNGSTVRGDTVLVATGRIPNGDLLDAELAGVEVRDGRVTVDEYQRTTARGIFALGDVSSDYQLKHVANHEARVVRQNLLLDWDDTDSLMQSDHRYVPSAVFTDPQIAMVGLTENQARALGFNISVKVQDYSDVAYGWAMEDTTGIAKIIVEAETGKILGAHIMGHQASSLIQPIIQAMSFGLHGQDMARGQYWIHPALPEVIENALLSLCGEPPWPPARRH